MKIRFNFKEMLNRSDPQIKSESGEQFVHADFVRRGLLKVEITRDVRMGITPGVRPHERAPKTTATGKKHQNVVGLFTFNSDIRSKYEYKFQLIKLFKFFLI